jgi:SAM-dependent methyltransferase
MERIVFQRLDQLESKHWWFCARRDIIASVIGRFAPAKKRLRLLEAGCGTGGNLQMLQRFGALDAFELDDAARDIARSKLAIDIKPGKLPDGIPFASGQFDVVTAFDVLEHVKEHEESLARLGEQLSPDGRLIITVPALPWLWSKHDETHHHFRRYTHASLTAALEKAGLQPLRVTYFNTLLFPLIAGLRLTRKLFGLSEGADDSMPSPLVNTVFKTIFGLEAHIVGRLPLPIGVSLLAVAKRANT